jgi:hypothetical protein
MTFQNTTDWNSFGYSRAQHVGPVDMGLKRSFGAVAGTPSTNSTHAPSAHNQLSLTDILPESTANKFHVPNVQPGSAMNAALRAGTPALTESTSKHVENTANTYMKMNNQVMNQCRDMMGEVNPETGKANFDHMCPGTSASSASAGAAIFSTGNPLIDMAMNAAAIISDIRAEMKFDNTRANADLTEALRRLQSQQHQQQWSMKTGGQSGTVQPVDWDKFQNAAQFRKFIERNPMNDPVMQKVKDARISLNYIKEEQKGYEIKSTDTLTASKVEAGDTKVIQTFAKNDGVKAEMIKAGAKKQDIDALPEKAEIARIGLQTLVEAKGMKIESPDFLEEDSKPAPTFNNEFDPRMIAANMKPVDMAFRT